VPRPRYVLPQHGVYHVTTRGVDRMRIARDAHDYVFVDDRIRRACFRFGWTYHAHCVMPNHYHLIVETALDRLSRGMQWLNWRIAHRFNARWLRVGHFVERRFESYVIDRDDHFENACLYVWNNPVRPASSTTPKRGPTAASRR
jgi:REP-associated tyrosine transposase